MKLIKLLNKYAVIELDNGRQIKQKLKFVPKELLEQKEDIMLLGPETSPNKPLELKEAVLEGACQVCGMPPDYELPEIYEHAKHIKGHKVWCSVVDKARIANEAERNAEKELDMNYGDDLEEIEKTFKQIQNE